MLGKGCVVLLITLLGVAGAHTQHDNEDGWVAGAKTPAALATRPWLPLEVPNPVTDPAKCGNSQPSFICDPEHILTHEARQQAAAVLAAIQSGINHTCAHHGRRGYQVAVVLVHQLRLSKGKASNTPASALKFARAVGNNWGVGNSGCEDGILLLLNTKDRSFAVATGKGVKDKLPDTAVLALLEHMAPALQRHHWDEAVLGTLLLIGKSLRHGSDVIGEYGQQPWWKRQLIVVGFLGLLFCLPSLCGVFGIVAIAVLKVMAWLADALRTCCQGCMNCTARLVHLCSWVWVDETTSDQLPPDQQQAHALLSQIEQEMERDQADPAMCAICL